MRVVLIEDNALKAAAIVKFVGAEFPEVDLEVAKSFQSGLKLVQAQPPALLILDMTLPNFDVEPGVRAGKPRPLGGYELLRKLNRRKVATAVVVLTQYETFGTGPETYSVAELREKCEREFPDLFRGLVYFSMSGTEWKKALSGAMAKMRGEGAID